MGDGRAHSISLAELTQPVGRADPQKAPDRAFSYIDISAIDSETNLVVSPQRILGIDAPSRARQSVRAGDILVSTVRPNLNAVALLDESHEGSVASTGFCVLRPDQAVLDANYAFHWVRTAQFVSELMQHATGASYPAVTDKVVKRTAIRLPPIGEQRRIAAVLDTADALRAKRHLALAKLDTLTQAIFIDMFGDPVSNPRSLPTTSLGEFGTLDRGVSKHRPRNDPALLGGDWPLIQTGDIANSGGYIDSYSSTYSDLGLAQSKIWPAGTLCITIAANIAKTGILMFDACFPDSVVGFTTDVPERSEYVRAFMRFLQPVLEQQAPESAQKNINLKVLRALEIPVPPAEEVARFSSAVASAVQLASGVTASRVKLDSLFISLQQRAFRGDL